MSIAERERVCSQLQFARPSDRSDLLDPTKTSTNLIAALQEAVLPHPDGQGHRLLITSVRTDHSDDSLLGPHGHARGFAVDVAMQDGYDDGAAAFVQDCCTNNREITKVGLGGMYQDLHPTAGATIVFADNTTDHIHLQVGGSAI